MTDPTRAFAHRVNRRLERVYASGLVLAVAGALGVGWLVGRSPGWLLAGVLAAAGALVLLLALVRTLYIRPALRRVRRAAASHCEEHGGDVSELVSLAGGPDDAPLLARALGASNSERSAV